MSRIILFLGSQLMLLCIIVAVVLLSLWFLHFQKALNMKWYYAILIALAHMVIGYVSAKLWAILEVGGDLSKAASLRLYGATFIVPLCYWIGAKLTKRKISLVMDVAAVACCMGLICTRMNCFKGGFCVGLPIPWLDGFRWPLRELEILYCAVFLIIFTGKVLHKKTNGEVMAYYFLSYGTLRFIMEWGREEFTTQVGVFHLAHIWSLIAIAIGAGIYYKSCRDNSKGKKVKNAKAKAMAKGGKRDD